MMAVKESVEPGSLVRTDGWGGYGRLPVEGYEHTIIRKSADVGENFLPLVNRGASLLKRWLLGTHQGAVRPSHLDYYLDEFTFRFNRRKSYSRGKLFFRLVQQGVKESLLLLYLGMKFAGVKLFSRDTIYCIYLSKADMPIKLMSNIFKLSIIIFVRGCEQKRTL
jgi:hypothetical protein